MNHKRLFAFAVFSGGIDPDRPPGDASIRDRLRDRIAQRMAGQIEADKVSGGRDIAYGAASLQASRPLGAHGPDERPRAAHPLRPWRRLEARRHGKRHRQGQGRAFSRPRAMPSPRFNYRLVPDATIEEQAADVAKAVKWVIDHGRRPQHRSPADRPHGPQCRRASGRSGRDRSALSAGGRPFRRVACRSRADRRRGL